MTVRYQARKRSVRFTIPGRGPVLVALSWSFFATRPDIDTFWMDDGARTSRFAPLYPNTGYYLIRHNPRTALLCETLVGMYDVVLAWQSHQAVVSQVLGEFHALHALTVKILDKIEFPSGKQFHHNRALFEKIKRKEFEPYCFHMCWTAGKADKLKFLKQDGLWYLEESCALKNLDADDAAGPACGVGLGRAPSSGGSGAGGGGGGGAALMPHVVAFHAAASSCPRGFSRVPRQRRAPSRAGRDLGRSKEVKGEI